ncbi:methyltransferase domain-containing protein [Streptomyces nojiriensis]|uniref:methyltransferase domain-containing protein n=1 Tax=Streptomyces nojiriensis TaxID=66374 RepID=UPI0036DC7E91
MRRPVPARRSPFAWALAREELGPRTSVLEIGTGTGALALHAARRGAAVTAVDVSWPAVTSARMNALLHQATSGPVPSAGAST